MGERKEMGWDEVHYAIDEAPFCEKRLRIVKGFFAINATVLVAEMEHVLYVIKMESNTILT